LLRIHFTDEDLARTTIAAQTDRLWEVLLSIHLLQGAEGEMVFGAWRRKLRRVVPASIRLLFDLAPPIGNSPDFLTPPGRGTEELEPALDAMLATPRKQVREDIAQLSTRRPATSWARALVEGERETMHRLGRAVTAYHQAAIAPYWPTIRSRVAADRSHRGRELVEGGVDRLLSNLHPRVRWRPPVLTVLDLDDTDVHLRGRGLTLVPSFFCWHAPTKLWRDSLSPVLVYPIQHLPGELRPDGPQTSAPVGKLLGRTRAAVLEATVSGCTTTELAGRCGVSLASASQHAAVLREAGLVTTRRTGGAVRHEATPLGVSLLGGSAAGATW
jgi:DNA-binding transcriptional ArsR family regulator